MLWSLVPEATERSRR